MKTDENGELLLPSGGYRRLKSFRLDRLIYDITVHFAELYIPADQDSFKAFVRRAENAASSVFIRNTPYKSVLVANATLLLISAATYFLKRQIDSKAKDFVDNGGFAERMIRMRRNNRNG